MIADEPPASEPNPAAAFSLALERLDEALGRWTRLGKADPLLRWTDRELDPEGVPRTMPVGDWAEALRRAFRAIAERPEGWPDRFDALAEGWFQALLRFSRSDGSAAFGPAGGAPDVRRLYRGWAERLPDPGLSTVLDWWFPGGEDAPHAPPPLPADARPDRVLAALRANWRKNGEFLAVDHRATGPITRVELCVGGRPWLGPVWGGPEGPATRAAPRVWQSRGMADVAEWSLRIGRGKVTRTAVLLRGRSLALFGEHWEGPEGPGGWGMDLAPGVTAATLDETRALALRSGRPGPSPVLIPIGLSKSPTQTESGALVADGGRIRLEQTSTGRRAWLPLLVSWEKARDRKALTWRRLTVTEDRRVCRPDEAFAARVAWGRDDALVIYRSLNGPATRAFLGHQTRARFLIGVFNGEGNVEPLVNIED